MPLAPFAVVGALALALALPAAAMADDGAPDARTIRVTGEGEVKIEPDIARITIGVTTNAERRRRRAGGELARDVRGDRRGQGGRRRG